MLRLFDLFIIFVKIGAILLGGGYVILPILTDEFCNKRNLISKDEIVNYFALAQSLPGIVAANISMLIGYKLKGKLGAIAAIIGIIFVPFWTIVLLTSFLGKIVNNTCVQSAFWGVEIAVIVLILLTIKEMWENSKKDLFFYFIFLSALVALLVFKLSPIQVIILFVIIGIFIKKALRSSI